MGISTRCQLPGFVWNQAPAVGWDNPYIIVLLIVSVLIFVAFMVWETKFSCDPLIPHSLKKADKNLHAVLLAMFFAWGNLATLLLSPSYRVQGLWAPACWLDSVDAPG